MDNERKGAVERLMPYVGDDRWNEVFLLVAGLLDDATEFAELYLAAAAKLVASDEQVVALLQWTEQRSAGMPVGYSPAAVRAFLHHHALTLILARDRDDLHHALTLTLILARDRDCDLAYIHDRDLALALALDDDYVRNLAHAHALEIAKRLNHHAFRSDLTALSLPQDDNEDEIRRRFTEQFAAVLDNYRDDWDPYRQMPVTKQEAAAYAALSRKQMAAFNRYLEANLLLVRCLQVAYVPDRAAIENRILLPP